MQSTAGTVRAYVDATPVGGFVHSADLVALAGARAAVDVALHRLCESGALRLVRRGLYYKGERTRFGMARPDVDSVAMEVLRGRNLEAGAGPAGMSAARALGLTRQVPAFEELAVCGRPPAPIPGVKFVRRAPAGRAELNHMEVALLEVLRVWPRFCEGGWSDLVEAVALLAQREQVSPATVHAASEREHHRQPRVLSRRLLVSVAQRSGTRPRW